MTTALLDIGGMIDGVQFQTWLYDQGFAPRTVQLYTQTLRRARRHVGPLDEATTDDLIGFVRTIPASRSSRAGARYALIHYYRYRGQRDGGPAADLPLPPAPHRLPRPIGQYDRLLTAARQLGGRYQVLGELLYFTACRISEVQHAAWHQFDLAADVPVWYIAGKGSRKRGAKVRQVPLRPELVTTLRAWRAGHSTEEYLFPSDQSVAGYVHVSTLRVWVQTIAAAAGIVGATPHRWRHSTATMALERTNDLRGVQEFLGHASLASTQVYTAVVARRLTDIVGAL